jgi:hypothetical protein
VPHLGIPLPIPVVVFTLVYCCLFVREQVCYKLAEQSGVRRPLGLINGSRGLAFLQWFGVSCWQVGG